MAREPKNAALPTSKGIADLLNVNDNTNVEVNVNVNDNDDTSKNIASNTSDDFDVNVKLKKLEELKAKNQASKKKETNRQVTVYLTPKNYKRFNALKEKGAKSDLINELLDIYFEE